MVNVMVTRDRGWLASLEDNGGGDDDNDHHDHDDDHDDDDDDHNDNDNGANENDETTFKEIVIGTRNSIVNSSYDLRLPRKYYKKK